MAELSSPELVFDKDGCPDCGKRTISLPAALPVVGDDFNWSIRDYDDFRIMMLEELAARFPERRRWTPGDLEVVIVEALAAVLDQLSDMLDRVASEAYLETARQPVSVYRLLSLIGYDAFGQSFLTPGDDPAGSGNDRLNELTALWLKEPAKMEAAKKAGPRSIHNQKRLVTLSDFDELLAQHPLVYRAHAWRDWGGAWPVVRVALSLWDDKPLDNSESETVEYPLELRNRINRFHRQHGLREIDWQRTPNPSIRTVLRILRDQYRMVGQEVILESAVFVGILISISVSVRQHYFQSEVRRAVEYALGRGPDGFFRPGRLNFGEDLYASDIFEALMKLEGVENVCLNRFKRVGRHFPDQTSEGVIVLRGLEVAVCDNNPAAPERGYIQLKLHGGRRG
jgi:hypothetical protein